MKFHPISASLSALVLSLGSSTAATYQTIFTLETVAATPGAELGDGSVFLDSVVAEGDKAYAFVRGNGGGSIVEYDGATSGFRTVMDNAAWGGASSALLGGFYGATVSNSGTELTFSNTFDNQAYRVNIGTGAVSTLTTSVAFDAATGGSVNLTAASHFTALGNGYAYDGSSDSILGVAANGTVTTAVSSSQLTTLMGNARVDAIVSANGNLYLGNNGTDSLYSWNLGTGTGSLLLDTAQIESVTDDIDGRAGFADFLVGPDGLGYFYESDSDYILSVDFNDPVNSLAVVQTEADLANGPAGNDAVGQLTWYDDELAWTSLRQGFNAVPEPSSTLLLGVTFLLGLARRKRA